MADVNRKVCDSANEVSESAEKLKTNYGEAAEEMAAQGEYIRRLTEKIENLAGKSNQKQ